MSHTQSRLMLIAGLVLMIAGAIDPMEGSVVILAGSAIAAAAAFFGKSPKAGAIEVAFVLIAVGVAAMFGFSALGGVGGTSGRSLWWMLTMAPYPIGWLIAIIATISALRAKALRGSPE